MKAFSCLACLVLVLAGCSSPKSIVQNTLSFGNWGEKGLVVGGTDYDVLGMAGFDENKKLVYSFALVFPYRQHYFPGIVHVNGTIKGRISSEKINPEARKNGQTLSADFFTEEGISETRKIADVVFDRVYYVEDNKIVFDKSFKELGIDLANRKAFSEEKLKPILEKMIRENVTPKEDKKE